MSDHQTRVERCDSHQRRSLRSGAGAHQRATGKGSGVGGQGPSAGTSRLSPPVQPAPLNNSKRANGVHGLPRGSSLQTTDSQRSQQNASCIPQGQQAGNAQSGMRSSTHLSNGNVTTSSRPGTPSTSSVGSSGVEPIIPKPGLHESPWNAGNTPVSLQFGTFGAAYVQIPARTSSAPPNLDEQQQDLLRFEAVTVPTPKVPVTSGGHQQGVRSQVQQSNGGQPQGFRPQAQQSTMTLSAGIPPQPHYLQNQHNLLAPVPQHPLPVPVSQPTSHMQASTMASAQSHLPVQAHFVPPQSQPQGLVQMPYSQHTLQPQPSLMQHSGGQVLKYPQTLAGSTMVGQLIGPPLAPLPGQQIPHQLPGGLANTIAPGMPGVPYGVVPTYITPRTSSALKIVHPETHEELKFDYKISKADDSARMMGNGPRSSLGYVGGEHPLISQNVYPQQNGLYTANFSHYHQPAPTISISSAVTATKSSVSEALVASEGARASKGPPALPGSTTSSSDKIASGPAMAQNTSVGFNIAASEDKPVTMVVISAKGEHDDEKAGDVLASEVSMAPSKGASGAQEPVQQVQADGAVSKDALRTDMPASSASDVKQNNKKKKKKDGALKVKASESKRHIEGKVLDPHKTKAGTPKMVENLETNTFKMAVPEAAEAQPDTTRAHTDVDSQRLAVDEQTVLSILADDDDETRAAAVPVCVNGSVTGVEHLINSVYSGSDDKEQEPLKGEPVEKQGAKFTVEAECVDMSLGSFEPVGTARAAGMQQSQENKVDAPVEVSQGIPDTKSRDQSDVSAADATLDVKAGEAVSLLSNTPCKVVDGTLNPVDLIEQQSIGDVEPCVLSCGKEDSPEETLVVAVPDIKHGSKKKKMKDILAKADAAGMTADLYNAYKAPMEKKVEEVVSPTVGTAKPPAIDVVEQQPVGSEHIKASKELDDWEDAVELPAPKGSVSTEGSQINGLGENSTSEFKSRKTYTRDFLLTFKEQNMELPLDFEARPNIVELFLNPQAAIARHADRNLPVRVLDRQLSGGARRGNPSNTFEDERWARHPHSPVRVDAYGDMGGGFRPVNPQGLIPRMPSNIRPGITVPPSVPFLIPGKPSTPGANPVLYRMNTVDSERWQRMPTAQKGLIPSPQTALPPVHKADNRYEVGKISDEEEQKQRQVKGILNKLTPQNFQKLFEQVKEVNILSAMTLRGVISQIFDKALTEPTFCEMYATFCKQLATDMPEFVEDDEKVTFKRVLLNKCQEEFQRGEREQAEASVTEEEGEDKLSPEERERKRLQAKRRMLGNIRFIGELYKKHMLTERIMHECIQKLLGEFENPEEEDVEALCKLMTTIGRMIDHPKVKDHIDAYLDRMERLSNNPKLSSRIRFMLKDVIDLRKNGWQERRKVEGPRKIEEVHRDAVQERQATVAQAGRLSRGASTGAASGRRLVPPPELSTRSPLSPMFSPATPMASTPSMRGVQPQIGLRSPYIQDVRMEDKILLESRSQPMPLSQWPIDEGPITLGPQGGLGRGMSVWGPSSPFSRQDMAPGIEPGDNRHFGAVSVPAHYGSSAERPLTPPENPLLGRPESGSSNRNSRHLERTLSDCAVSTLGAQQQPNTRPSTAPTFVALNEEQLRKKSQAALLEYFSARDLKEATQCIEELRAPKFHPMMVSMWIGVSLEKQNLERELLAKLLVDLQKSEPFLLNQEQILEGFQLVMETWEDLTIDTPMAPEYLAEMLVGLLSAGTLLLEQVGRLLKSDEVLQSGFGQDILGKVLLGICHEGGESLLVEMFRSSGIQLEDYIMPGRSVLDFLQTHNVQCLGMDSDNGTYLGIHQVGAQLLDHLSSNEPVLETLRWLERSTTPMMQKHFQFLQILMTQILKYSIPKSLEKAQISKIINERLPRYKPLLTRFGTDKEKQQQYIVALQLYVHDMGHPAGLMTALFNTLYEEEVISESRTM